MGQEFETEENETLVVSRTVGKRRGDSTVPVEEKVESRRAELSIPGDINVTHDSSEPNTKIGNVLARPGELWDRTEVADYGNGQTLTFHKKYEYVGTEKKGDKTFDKITSTTTRVELKQDPPANAQLKLLNSNVKVDSSDETILFDREQVTRSVPRE
jgi:hypothetical protein